MTLDIYIGIKLPSTWQSSFQEYPWNMSSVMIFTARPHSLFRLVEAKNLFHQTRHNHRVQNANKEEGHTKEEGIFPSQEENPRFRNLPSSSICIEPWWIKIIKKFNQPLLLPSSLSSPLSLSFPTMFSGAMRNIGPRFSRKDASEEN